MRNEQWKAICEDISDRRGLKWEWSRIDDDVKADIRAAWELILDAPPKAVKP